MAWVNHLGQQWGGARSGAVRAAAGAALGGLAGVRVLGVFVWGTERKRSACACAVQEHTETRPACVTP